MIEKLVMVVLLLVATLPFLAVGYIFWAEHKSNARRAPRHRN